MSSCSNHGYADDNTIWKVVNPVASEVINRGLRLLEQTLEDVRSWMFANKLFLNDSKTEFIVFAQKRHTMPCHKSHNELEMNQSDP